MAEVVDASHDRIQKENGSADTSKNSHPSNQIDSETQQCSAQQPFVYFFKYE
ncbi:MAG: hypothetical protein PUK54_02715 [Firmicutes bacterium]|nr:hypothetical protein [Bacillota bacterium]MDY5857080.1 hypothetical protein [Anaerovoracaceae bacterium]